MAYKRDDNGGQAASAAPSGGSSGSGGGSRSLSSGGSKAAVKASSSGAGKSYSSSKASAKASSSGQGKVYSGGSVGGGRSSGGSRGESLFSKSVSAGSRAKKGTTASFDAAMSPAWVGKNPYQWGNTSTIVNHWDDTDPERQAKLNALGFAADDPDRTFHFYEPDKGSPKSYLDQANALSSDRNYYQAGNFWNTINGQYASEEDRVSDAMEWMKDAQIYGKWAKDHDLTYTDENGEEKSMEDAWKEIWSYANDIAGGIGDSDSTIAQKNIQTYLTGGEYNSEQTKQLLEQARQFSENAESEKDAKLWADLEKSLSIQLKDDEKREKREGSFLGKAGNLWDTFTGMFERPEREEQGELTDTQRAYQQAAEEDQMYAGWATDPLSAAAFAPTAERRDELAEQVKEENREAGREVYAGMAPEDRLSDMTESWLGGRGAGTMAGVAGGLYAADSMFYDNDEIRELTQRKFIADQNLLTTGDQKYREESEALQAQIDEAQQRAIENGENGTPLGDAAGMLLDSARGMQATADQQWQDATEDMSEGERFLANVGKTGADVAADIVENAIAPGVGTMRMYLGAGGSGAMEQAGRENNDPDSIATATITRAASAWLSTKLVGGMESAYGQSILGGITERAFANASPAVQAAAKTLLNTEGVEEGLEDILNYAGDLILGLNEEAQLNWDEVKQDALVGYVLGVLTNGLSAGINYNSKARHALAEEAVEFAQSGLSIEEAAEIGKESTKEDIVMKPQPESADLQAAARAGTSAAWDQETAASQSATLEGQDTSPAPAPTQTSEDIASTQAAALESQETAPQPAPAPAQATTASGPAADKTKPYEGPTLPGASYGGGDVIEIGVDEVPVHFAVIPLSELQASHDVHGNPNPNYPAELQPRDRTSEEYQAEARERGAKLNPRKLEAYADATTGAPVVRSDGVVISGNGRTLAITNAFDRGNGGKYTEYMRQNAARFGIDPASIGEDSVLVRVIDGEDYDWGRLAAGGNDSNVTRYNAAEAAKADAKVLMSDDVRDILNLLDTTPGTDITSASNEAFVREFIQKVIPDSDRNSMTTWEIGKQGEKISKITGDAYVRAKNAIFTAAYGDSEISSQMALSAETGRIIDAMVYSAPKVLAVEAGVQDGSLSDFNLRGHMVDALRLYNDAKNAGQSVAQMTANMSMFSESDPDTIYIARLIEEQRNAPRKMQAFFDGLCDKIMRIGAPDSDVDGFGLFGDEAPETFAFSDVIEGGRENYAAETKDRLPAQNVWGRGSYDELADVAGLNQKERAEYYRDESRAQRSPTDSGYAGESGSVPTGETDAGNTDGNEAGGADARVSELASRMEAGEVSDEEYLALVQSEEGRAQLAQALGLPNSDIKTVADGLSVYLILQDQIQQNQTQTDDTVVDNLLGTEPEAAYEPAAESATVTQENPTEVNSQADETNAPEAVLNAQESGESANPLAEIAEEASGNPNPEQKVNENVDTQREAVQNRREKISQYFTNTLTESGRAKGLDPITYNPTSEAESLTNAAMRLAQDKQAVLDQLMTSPAWNGELVDAAWMLENEFYKEFAATGDKTNWDAWRKLETYKISETAKGLQAVAKQSRPGAAGVLEASLNLLEDFKKKGSKQNQAVSQKETAKAEKNVTDVAYRMAEIENEIDQRTESGMDEAEARAMSKDAYLDLAEKINEIRNTGKMFFGGKRKFRNMLGSQDMDFIQRFVACQAAGIAEDVNYKGKQDRLKQLNTFQKLAQLTGTGTWSRNLQGNATFGAIDLLANNGVAVAVDQIVGKITGQRSTGFELGALSRDARAASKRALDRSILEVAANIDLAENSAMEGYDLSRTRTFDPNGNIVERVLSRWEQWNGYMLNSSDKFFRGGTEESVTRAIARANGWDVNNLTAQQKAEIRETAQQVADYRLFQNNGVAAEAADSIREGLNKLGAKAVGRTYEKGQFGLGTALTPYTKVPTNIGVKALEFSPAGAVKGFAEIVRTARDSKAGKATMAQQNQAVTDFARGVTGTALIVGLAQLMKNWPFFKDWENEDDKDVLAQNRAEGKSGMQFNIDMLLRGLNGDKDTTWRNGDRTIDISSIEPANQLLTAASLIAEGLPAQQAILQSAKENFMQLPSVSALANIENTIKYTDTPDDLGQTLLNTVASTAGSVASGFIPAPIRHGTTVVDEYARDTSGNNATERALNQFKASVPGLRETLPVKTDNYGNEITSGDFGTRLLNTYGGNRYTQINQGDVSREAERLREATGEKLTPGRNGPSSEKFGDEKVKLTAEERKSWKDDYGQDLDDAVGLLMRSSIYRDADDELKAQLWQNLEGYVKDGVKREFAEDHDLKHDSDYAYLDDVDNPVTFLTASKAFNLAEKQDDWDVVDALIGPVGKLSEDEKDLMREKNRTLMSYYDYLTPNARGNQVKDAASVHSYKEAASANAKARGVTSPSGMDKYSAVVSGYRDKKFTDDDVDAFMTKQASDGDWEVTKGRAALYLAARAGGATVREAFDIIDSADVDQDGTIDEKGFTQKAEHEGTNALKRAGISDQDAMWYAFNEIMYPWKNK